MARKLSRTYKLFWPVSQLNTMWEAKRTKFRTAVYHHHLLLFFFAVMSHRTQAIFLFYNSRKSQKFCLLHFKIVLVCPLRWKVWLFLASHGKNSSFLRDLCRDVALHFYCFSLLTKCEMKDVVDIISKIAGMSPSPYLYFYFCLILRSLLLTLATEKE